MVKKDYALIIVILAWVAFGAFSTVKIIKELRYLHPKISFLELAFSGVSIFISIAFLYSLATKKRLL